MLEYLNMKNKKVIIIQRVLPHYRVSFFDLLFENLKNNNIDLTVVYGQEKLGEVPKSVDFDRKWALKVENKYFSICGCELVWQPIFAIDSDFDMVIVEQANRLLVNYCFMLKRYISKFQLSFWGHGKNFQSKNPLGILEKWKGFISMNVDWWFTYTEKGSSIISSMGYPINKITAVKNSIETTCLFDKFNSITKDEISSIKNKHGIYSDNVGIYCGGLYAEKRIQFLIESCLLIKSQVRDFEIIVIGGGPDEKLIADFSLKYDWVHFLGPLTGDSRLPYFSLSKIMLMPGMVGLAVLDSFVFNVPMITTDILTHSPEFDYLENNVNGLVVSNDTHSYANSVVSLLQDHAAYSKLLQGCRSSAVAYSVENMALNFSSGINSSLAG